MPKAPSFPIVIKSGSVSIKVYRVTRPAANGRSAREFYSVAWTAGGRRNVRQFSDLAAAQAEARLKAEALAAGRSDAAIALSMGDVHLLAEVRRLCGKVPVLSAVEEWARAREITGGNIIPAANLWKGRNAPTVEPITVAQAVERFVASKDASGKQGTRTYQSKLKPLAETFGEQLLHLITAPQLETYLARFGNGVTRNDFRKRTIALFKWAQRSGYLPRGIETEAEQTDRATEETQRIGILAPADFEKILRFVADRHPEHLAAVVIAGFCGVRSDEIHGKRADRGIRQRWEDIDLARGVLTVSNAKKGTAGYRRVPVCPAAVKWLMRVPIRSGPVCAPGALEKLRLILREAKVSPLPENAFRHSYCSYRLALTKNPQQVAYEAGNSPALLRKHYAELASEEDAASWFAIEPAEAGAVVQMTEASA